MRKANTQSVTTIPCECGYLERCANAANTPVVFDEELNEYQVTYDHGGRRAALMIYHCPWCGGVASDSHRASLFHELNHDECDAIQRKTKACASIEDVISLLGPPDQDGFTTIGHAESSEMPPRVEKVRQATYSQLYEKMSVSFIQQIDGALGRTFVPKPLK